MSTQARAKIQASQVNGGKAPSVTPEPASLPHGMVKGTDSRSSHGCASLRYGTAMLARRCSFSQNHGTVDS
jgi:hypothetical protein